MLLWILLLLIPLLFGLYAQMRVSSTYSKNLQILSRSHMTGREAAAAVMSSAGINDVEIVQVEGKLSDHFDPVKKQLALSTENYNGYSLAAVGVAAHEAGHAIQQKVGYRMMQFRQTLVPAVQIASPVAMGILSFGIFIAAVLGAKVLGVIMLQIGVVALLVIALFQLVTLPVEFDASRRAKVQLVRLGILQQDEMKGVNETLDAAALTYLAAFVATLGNLVYLLMILSGGRRND